MRPAPYNTFTPLYGQGKTPALGPGDVMNLCAADALAMLQVSSQRAINSGAVDMTDVHRHDMDDLPTYARQLTALELRPVNEGVLDYIASTYLAQDIAARSARFEEWAEGSRTLDVQEEERVEKFIANLIRDEGVSARGLLHKIDDKGIARNDLQSLFETLRGCVTNDGPEEIKAEMRRFPEKVRERFARYRTRWDEAAVALCRRLADSLEAMVREAFPAAVHLQLGALERIAQKLDATASDLQSSVDAAEQQRASSGRTLQTALDYIQRAHGLLGVFGRADAVRDAAFDALNHAVPAAQARFSQECGELALQVLRDGLEVKNPAGERRPVLSVLQVIRERRPQMIASARKNYAALTASVEEIQDNARRKIERGSPVFQRALLHDGKSVNELDAEAERLRERVGTPPGVVRLLRGECSVPELLQELLPLLPDYRDIDRPLLEVLQDSEYWATFAQIVRNARHMLPTNRLVEEQLQLRNRRDTLEMLELPGGQEGPLGEWAVREDLVRDPNHIVDSGDPKVARYVFIRDGLPLAIFPQIQHYQARYDRYMAHPGSISPHTFKEGVKTPPVQPPRTNLTLHTKELLYVAKATLPERVKELPSGAAVIHHRQATEVTGYTVDEREELPNFQALVNWTAKHPDVRKELEERLRTALDTDPDRYIERLRTAWTNSIGGEEKDFLRNALHRLRIDPQAPPPKEARS